MKTNIDYKKGVLFINFSDSFTKKDVSFFKFQIIPIILNLSNKKFNGNVIIISQNEKINSYLDRADIHNYCKRGYIS